MRADMAKVLVERPRPGSRGGSRPRKGYLKAAREGLDAGDAPARERMTARCGGTRSFNEHLGPLRRFLDRNVGRPWDKVYAGIAARVDRGNVVQKHILTHLFEYVVTKTVLIDGEPHAAEMGWPARGGSLRTSEYRHRWYVCPKSGLLKRSRHVTRRRALPRRRWVGEWEVLLTLDGRWERVTVAPVSGAYSVDGVWDVARGRTVHGGQYDREEAARFYGRPVYAVARCPVEKWEPRDYPFPARVGRR